MKPSNLGQKRCSHVPPILSILHDLHRSHMVPSYQISLQWMATIELLCANAPWIPIQTCGTYSRQKSLHPRCPMVPMVPNGAWKILEDPGSTIGYPLLPAKNMLKICIFEHDLTISYCVSLSQVPRSSHIVTHWLPTVTATKGPPSHFRVPKDAGKSEMLML